MLKELERYTGRVPNRVNQLSAFLCSLMLLAASVPSAAADNHAKEGGGASDAKGSSDTKEAGGSTADKKPEENVRTGVIATTGSFGFGATGVDSDSTGAAPGDEVSVITGSVSKSGRDGCQVQVTNTSEENGYSVSYRVIGRNNRGSKVFGKGFSRSLKPGESHKREFRCDPDWRMEVDLRSAKRH